MSLWNDEAATFAEHWSAFAAPAQRAVADALELREGMKVLDVGCGAGRFCALAASRGAAVSGLDGAPAMIEIASRAAPGADLCVGPLDQLPWPEGTFDAVTGFNSLQFAADPVAALREWARVTRPGGAIAITVWGPRDECELELVEGVVRSEPPPERFCHRLVETVAAAGLGLREHGSVAVPFEVPDLERLELALGFEARGLDIPEAEALAMMVGAATPFRRADGSYRLENVFRYAISSKPYARRTPARS
jgi:SAM-dependent methyltransferase